MRAVRHGGVFLLWLALGFVFTLLLAAALPLAIGDRSFTVRSGSMSPAIDTGDVIVTEPVSPTEVEVGDIVTFRDPEGTDKLYSHRVQSIATEGAEVSFVTRGDANTSIEHWRVPVDGSIGRVVYRVPKLGFAVRWIATPAARQGLIALLAGALCWLALARIWRRDPDPELGVETPDALS